MVERPTRLETLVRIAEAISERGTCSRLQVGAVIHREGRVLSTGYNGAPAGVRHCDHTCRCIKRAVPETDFHEGWCYAEKPCELASHAERNAIDWAARHGVALLGSELVTTDTPCLSCAGSIINAGICAVWSVRPFRDDSGVKLLKQGRVEHHMVGDYIGQAGFPYSRH